MPRDTLSHVTTWVFDLDHTLYPPETALFSQIEPRMTAWVMQVAGVDAEEADALRLRYWREYGTTWAGLEKHHGLDLDAFLHDVHQIDFSVLTPDPALNAAIGALPGRRIVYTNGTADYARNVLRAIDLEGAFDAVYGVQCAGHRPKPERSAFETVFTRDGLEPTRAAMFEDDPRNLLVPHEMGLATVHVAPEPDSADHIHHHTDDLAGFLVPLAAPRPD